MIDELRFYVLSQEYFSHINTTEGLKIDEIIFCLAIASLWILLYGIIRPSQPLSIAIFERN